MSEEFSLNTLADELDQRIRSKSLLDLPVDWADELVYPAYESCLSLQNIPHSIADLFGVALPDIAPLDDSVWAGECLRGEIDRIVLFLSDGLGFRYLQQRVNADVEFYGIVRDLTDGRGPLPLTSIAPSTTAVALPTLWTGASPATHGMIGTVMLLREFSMLANMLFYNPAIGRRLRDSLEDWGLKPEDFVEVPGFSEQLAKAGIPTHLLLEKGLNGTGLSRILHRGVKQNYRHIYGGYNDIWRRFKEVLQQTRGQRCYVSIYRGVIDFLGHTYGSHSAYVEDEIKDHLRRIRDVINEPAVQDGRTLVIITADHGHYDAPEKINLIEDAEAAPIREAMRLGLSGDMRLGYLHLCRGYRESVMDVIAERYADCLSAVEAEVALESGFLGRGPISLETVRRLGDLILIPRLGWQVTDSSVGTVNIVGWHGGLSDWEMMIPLLWKRI